MSAHYALSSLTYADNDAQEAKKATLLANECSPSDDHPVRADNSPAINGSFKVVGNSGARKTIQMLSERKLVRTTLRILPDCMTLISVRKLTTAFPKQHRTCFLQVQLELMAFHLPVIWFSS